MSGLLVALAGLPGVGKSTFAAALGHALQAPVLSVDPVEAAILRSGIPRSFETGLAAYQVVETLADAQLSLGMPVIVDAANFVEPARAMWRQLAARRTVQLRFVELVCSDLALHQARVESRGAYLPGIPDVTWADVERRARETEPWSDPRLVLDSAKPEAELIGRVIAELHGAF